jgi:N utilization substance protein A
LSLAIGKKGQNVRLAAKLTGWKIDIKSEEEKRKEVEKHFGALEAGEPLGETANTEQEDTTAAALEETPVSETPDESPAAIGAADEAAAEKQ